MPRTEPRPEMTASPRIAAILLASGASKRMKGTDKLLEKIDGMPLLRRSALACMPDVITCVLAVLPEGDRARRAALDGLEVRILENPAPEAGIGHSLARAVTALPAGTEAALVHLADMPDIRAEHVAALCSAFPPRAPRAILRAASGTRPGHPVLFGRAHFPALSRLRGDRGARGLIAAQGAHLRLLPLPGRAALTDLDTPGDWAAYRAR